MTNDQFAMIKTRLTLINERLVVVDDRTAVLNRVVGLTDEAGEFEARLAEWQAGEPLKWAELMAAWVKLPTTPATRSLVLRLILGLLEK